MLFDWNQIQTVHWESKALLNQREMKNLDILLNTFIKQFRYLWHREQNLFDIFWMIFFSDGLSKYFSSDETILKPVDVSDIRVVLRVLLIIVIIKLLRIILVLIHSIAEVLDVPQILLVLLWTFVRSTNPLSTRTDAKNKVKNIRKKYVRPHQALHSTTVSAPSSYFLLFRLQTI